MWSTTAEDILEPVKDENEEDYTPSIKKQKQKKQLWPEKSMIEALNCCKNQELGIEEASLIYGIPKRSLRSRLKDKNFSVIDDKYRVFLVPVFPVKAELELVDYLQDLTNTQFTFTSIEVRRLAYELLSEKYHLNNLPLEKDCLLGNRWYQTFIAKYPHLGIENSKSLEDMSKHFYDSLETLILENEIESSRIFAVDAIELKFRANNAYEFDKIYHRRKIIYTDAKAICCISPLGVFIPSVFIKPDDNRDKAPATRNVDGSGFTANDSIIAANSSYRHLSTAYGKLKDLCDDDTGLLPTAEEVANIRNQIKSHMNKKMEPMTEESEEELREKLYEQFTRLRNKIISKYEKSLNIVSSDVFHEWFRTFIARVKPSPERKVILVLGDQNHVKCLRTLELAKASGVRFVVLPPHSAHKIYPLDGFTMSLNRNLSTCAGIWLGKNPDFKIQEVPLHDLFNEAYKMTVNATIAKNGFMYSGVWPVNRNIFDSTELGGKSILLKSPSHLHSTYGNIRDGSGTSQTTNFGHLRTDGLVDMTKLCRVCMKEKMYMKPLFESLKPNYHGKKISDIVGREISSDDGLPHLICQCCLVQLMDMVKIKNVTIDSHKKLSKIRDSYCYGESGSNDNKVQCRRQTMDTLLTGESEMNSFCRICMEEKPLMSSIYSGSQTASKYSSDLSKKIAEVSQCEIHLDDGLPTCVCAFCRTSINQAWDFIRKVLGSDERLREIVSQERREMM